MDYLVSQLRKALNKLNEADPDGIQYTLKTAQAGGLLYVKLDVAEEASVSTRRGRQQKGLAA